MIASKAGDEWEMRAAEVTVFFFFLNVFLLVLKGGRKFFSFFSWMFFGLFEGLEILFISKGF